MLDGGAPVPRPPLPPTVHLVPVRRLCRVDDALVPLAGDGAPAAPLADVLAARRRLLEEAIAAIRPDVVVVEHFPFSKWTLADEILGAVRRARAARAAVRVVCSVRDVVARTRFETGGDRVRAAPTLNAHFDALLVHGDPRLVRLEDSFSDVPVITIPIVYTGIVSEKMSTVDALAGDRPRIVASSGGGSEGIALAHAVVRAFRAVADALPGAELSLYTGLFFSREAIASLGVEARRAAIRLEPFSSRFLAQLAAADVSVSRAGYNTCANVLEARVRAVLVPSTHRSDQCLRAARLQAAGFAHVLAAHPPVPEAIAAAVLRAAARPRPIVDLDLDGAERSAVVIADLARALSPS